LGGPPLPSLLLLVLHVLLLVLPVLLLLLPVLPLWLLHVPCVSESADVLLLLLPQPWRH
jgi:hypothetical protein